MLWAPQDPGNVCSAPNSCLHLAELEDNRAPSPMPPSMKSARLRTVSSSGQHGLASWARSIRVATSGLCWLKSQHRWLMNMKSLFNVKSLWLFFFQINSFGALQAVHKTVWAKEKGHFNQNSKFPCLIPFPWVPNQCLKYMFVDSMFVLVCLK